MIVISSIAWADANQRFLLRALAQVRHRLERYIDSRNIATPRELLLPVRPGSPLGLSSSSHDDDAVSDTAQDEAILKSSPPSLETLCATFHLSPFERDLLLLSAGAELDASFSLLCATAQGNPQRIFPTFSLALAALPQAHWSALTPQAPLRSWRLIDVAAGNALTLTSLRIDEPILHYLAGLSYCDERLAGILEPVDSCAELAASHWRLVRQLAKTWSQARNPRGFPIIQLCGATADARAIAERLFSEVGLRLNHVRVNNVPTATNEVEILARMIARDAALSRSALLVDFTEVESDPVRVSAVVRLIENMTCAVALISRGERIRLRRGTIAVEVPKLAIAEQCMMWHSVLGSALNGEVEQLASQFNLNGEAIHAANAAANRLATQTRQANLAESLWDACRAQVRPRLDELAQRIESAASWADLVLPEGQLQILRQIVTHVRYRATVYETWGFAAKGSRGLGISTLFAGASGTGKTMAAEVLANELRLDLCRIDLASVVSKYIGETEKNLRRVFDTAEEGGAILLFDEADALFGKRSEVKDSHDRYANIEVSYLLQRMECYRGLAILTTNMKSALDGAFLRRIRFIVQFPFPDLAQRAEIWRRIFPSPTPTLGLDPSLLAQLSIAGGNIRNIALSAAFLAAETREPVQMRHVLGATRTEYAKLEKVLTESEIRGWA